MALEIFVNTGSGNGLIINKADSKVEVVVCFAYKNKNNDDKNYRILNNFSSFFFFFFLGGGGGGSL